MTLAVEKRPRLSKELHIIPGWAIGLAIVGFAGMQILMNVVVARQANAPPVVVRTLLGLLAGVVLSVYLALVGYVSVDSKRRGMNRLLWTLVAAFVPNGFGILLYFILRQPIAGSCPNCQTTVQAGYLFCPKCGTRLHLSCPSCHREIHPGDRYCPNCGKGVE
jgi:hypothetical protein